MMAGPRKSTESVAGALPRKSEPNLLTPMAEERRNR